jgi:hypothetical protein
MNFAKLVVAWLVVGVVISVLDMIFHGFALNSYYMQLPIMRQDASAALLVLGTFVFALVFVVAYDRLYATRECRAGRGATFGFWTGVLLNFPANIFLHLMFVGFPYRLTWIWTVYGIVEMTIIGAIAGAIYAKKQAARPAVVG